MNASTAGVLPADPEQEESMKKLFSLLLAAALLISLLAACGTALSVPETCLPWESMVY